MEDVQGIRRRLRRAMGESGFSIRKLSKTIRKQTTDATGKPARGSSYTSLRDFIHGVVDEPRPNILEEAAKALAVSSDWLIRGEGEATERDRKVVELAAELVGTGDLRADLQVGKVEGRGKVTLPGLGTKGAGTTKEPPPPLPVMGKDGKPLRVLDMTDKVKLRMILALGHEPHPTTLGLLAYTTGIRMGSLIEMVLKEGDAYENSADLEGLLSVERLPARYVDNPNWANELDEAWEAEGDEAFGRAVRLLPVLDEYRVAQEVAEAFRAPFDAFGIDPDDLSDSFVGDYIFAMAPIILSLARIRPVDPAAGDDVRINYRGGWMGFANDFRRQIEELRAAATDTTTRDDDEQPAAQPEPDMEVDESARRVRFPYRGYEAGIEPRGGSVWAFVGDGDAETELDGIRPNSMLDILTEGYRKTVEWLDDVIDRKERFEAESYARNPDE